MEVKGTIDRFEGDVAVIITNDRSQIIWPKNKLDANFKEGDAILFNISNSQEQKEQKNNKAKDILNEILKTDDED